MIMEFLLYYIILKRVSYKEISEIMLIPEGTIKSRLNKRLENF